MLPFIIDGLLLGFVYGIAAMGLTLIWGVMNVINLAHGPIIALGSFGVYFLFTGVLHMNPYLALVPGGCRGPGLGMLIYVVAIRRVIDAPHLSTLLATFSINMIIIGLGTRYFTTTPRTLPDFSMGSYTFGSITVLGTRLVAALAAILVQERCISFFTVLHLENLSVPSQITGRAAELMGIPSHRVLALSFGLGTMLAAISGGLIATFFPFTSFQAAPMS
jgi:branched-chain amino acid transport system permease protein